MTDMAELLGARAQALAGERAGVERMVDELAARTDRSAVDDRDLDLLRAELVRIDEDLDATRQRVAGIAEARRSSEEAADVVRRYGLHQPGRPPVGGG